MFDNFKYVFERMTRNFDQRATSTRLPLAAGKALVKNRKHGWPAMAARRTPCLAGGGAVALSMEEQRMLDEMERKLAEEDPRLASRFNSFGHRAAAAAQLAPGAFGSQRARTISGLLAFVLIAAVTVMMFALSPYASHHQSPAHVQPTAKTTAGKTPSGSTG